MLLYKCTYQRAASKSLFIVADQNCCLVHNNRLISANWFHIQNAYGNFAKCLKQLNWLITSLAFYLTKQQGVHHDLAAHYYFSAFHCQSYWQACYQVLRYGWNTILKNSLEWSMHVNSTYKKAYPEVLLLEQHQQQPWSDSSVMWGQHHELVAKNTLPP